nr:hypothetical protein [Tanacetum cinerariifolium]
IHNEKLVKTLLKGHFTLSLEDSLSWDYNVEKNASYSNHPHRDSVNLKNIFNISSEDCLEVLILNKQSGNPTFSLHKEIASPEVTHEIHDSKGCDDSDFKDSIDQTDLANHDDLFVDPTPEMFTDEQPPDYSFPPRFDVYPDDFLEIESDVFNPGILIHEKSITIITRVAQEKKLAVSYASLLFEDFDPPFYELLAFKKVPDLMRLLPFSSENEEKVFKPGIYTFEKVHCCFLSELSHPGERIPKKGQNQIKTGQKREARRSREKSKAVTVDKESYTEENTKRRARNAKSYKFYKKKKGKKD